MLRAASVVVGPYDEVLQSNAAARTFGLVRGTRVDPPELLDMVRQVRRRGDMATMELIQERRRAASRQVSLRVAPIGGGLIVVLGEDRTAARRVDETRRDFVANVSHELKTPLGAIQLLAEAVEDAADDPEAVRRFAGKLGQESTRLTELVTQLIGLSRLQADDPMLRAEPVNVDGVLRAAVNHCRQFADSRDITIAMAPPSNGRVLGDAEQLTQAVTNLIHNAIAYSDPEARVAVASRTVEEDGEAWINLSVSDNGIGISPEDQRRIFERFYRVDYSRSRDSGGTGLGLSIVKHIAIVHGGSVSVWSQPGQGSTFTLHLPALTQTAVQAANQLRADRIKAREIA